MTTWLIELVKSPADIDAILGIEEASFTNPWTKEMYLAELENKGISYCYLAKAGGPGGATDTVSSFIYRVYRDRSNVGYGTALAMFYLLMIIVLLTVLLRLSSRWTQKVA